MSSAAPFRARCPACTREFVTEVWRSLHVRRMPAAREELLAGQFCVHPCPACGTPCRLEPVLLYTDFERGEWYALYPGWALADAADLARQVEAGFRRNTIELAAPMVREMTAGFQVRTCFGIPALREKVLAHALGLDDRVVELWKLRILRGLGRRVGPHEELWLVGEGDDRLRFELADPPGPDGVVVVRELSVPRADYDRVATQVADSVEIWFPDSLVDWRVALVPQRPAAARSTA